jgi:hypothetical protein
MPRDNFMFVTREDYDRIFNSQPVVDLRDLSDEEFESDMKKRSQFDGDYAHYYTTEDRKYD